MVSVLLFSEGHVEGSAEAVSSSHSEGFAGLFVPLETDACRFE